MTRTRRRPGPKSKTLEEKIASDEEIEAPAEPDDAEETPKKPSVSSSSDTERVQDETDEPGKSTRKDKGCSDETVSTIAEDKEEDLTSPKENGEPILNEIDGSLVNAPEEEEDVSETEPVKPVLRLVPLTQLLKPEVLEKPANKSRKSSGRAKKSTSYIEISSDSESEGQISISSTTDDEGIAKKVKKKGDAGSSKENNSTNSKLLSNGSSKKNKHPENVKELEINLERMPNNVNKLMRCYKVSQTQIESWSDEDDFESLISTSKIDRNAPEEPKDVEKPTEPAEKSPKKKEKSRKKEKGSDDDASDVSMKKDDRPKRPERNSARNAKIKSKTVIESDESGSESSDEDETPLLSIRNAKKADSTTRGRGRSSKVVDSEPSPASKEKSKKKRGKETTESEASSSDNKKSRKNKKKKDVEDDHAEQKVSKKRREKSTSSEEEEKEAPPKRRSTKKAKELPAPSRATRSRKEPPPSEKSLHRKGKSNDLKITISLKNKLVAATPSDESNASSGSDSETLKKKDEKKVKKPSKTLKSSASSSESEKPKSETSESEDERIIQPAKFNKIKSRKTSSTENESSEEIEAPVKSDTPDEVKGEIDEEEKLPILDQKLRNRNKFEKNSAFLTLKEKIEQRKGKRKVSEDELPKSSSQHSPRKPNGDKEKGLAEKNNNDDSESKLSPDEEDDAKTSIVKAKRLAVKRKRLISSSEDEPEENGEIERNSKKKKMSESDDSEYEQGSGNEKESENSDENDKNGSSSEDEDQPRKKKKKGTAYSDDDDDEEDLEKNRPKEKRRKRIKKVASSDEDGENDENGDKTKSGRKNIRKMMRADKLDVSTKEAAKIERERKQRIEERQKMYNQFYDERPEEAKVITQLVLDFSEKSKKPLLQVDKTLASKLKPHQANGVKFMWDACFESLERSKNDLGSGCILAHCMGLGKTLQVVTLVHTLLKNYEKSGVSRVLVVCPLSTVLNWVNEFNIWLKDIEGRDEIYVYEINKLKQNVDRANKLMEWHNDGGIMILSYDMFRNLTNDTGSRFRKKIKESLQTSLVDPGPDLVICDEGHLLKNEKTSISKAMMKLRTLRRIVLTGTPLQNNLKEYYCMVQFVKPNLLGKYQEYLNRFVNPITNGQYTDSTEYDIQVMRRRAHVLHKMLDGCVQRRDYSVLAPFLPPKHEYVLSLKLTPMQVKLYKYYMENRSRSNDENGGRKGSILFQDFQNLQRIWTHPLVLRYNSNRYEVEMQRRKDMEDEDEDSEGSLKEFIDDSESAASTSSSSSGGDSDDDAVSINSDEPKKSKKKKKQKGPPLPRRTRAKAAEFPSDHEAEEVATATKKENPTEWWMSICPEEELNNIAHSSKLSLLMSILEECEAIGDKLLVFSQSLYSLDVIEHFLNVIDEQTQNSALGSFAGSWTQGQDYFRLDGSTPVEQRNTFCKHFNSPSNPRARLFLISTRAGGLGINLVAANRVIIFDVSWNPSHDIQSIFRVYRFGQTKPCYIYRFIALGTMEEKIYERQVTKQAISKRVIDEQQIDRHYNQTDLQELYNYDLDPDDERILPILPKDRLFAEMLKKYEDMIYKYHEHDTLLENKEEETLGEDERKQAWEEFEMEKNRPQFPPQYIPQQPRMNGPVTSNNIFGIRTDVLLKLLSMKARLDHPAMPEMQVKQAIPLLMQELYRQMDRGELTLYQQLITLSSSLEVPSNYGGQFRVNENMLSQTYNSMHSMPSTSSFSGGSIIQQHQQAAANDLMRYTEQHRQQQQFMDQMKRKAPQRILGSVIEID